MAMFLVQTGVNRGSKPRLVSQHRSARFCRNGYSGLKKEEEIILPTRLNGNDTHACIYIFVYFVKLGLLKSHMRLKGP